MFQKMCYQIGQWKNVQKREEFFRGWARGISKKNENVTILSKSDNRKFLKTRVKVGGGRISEIIP